MNNKLITLLLALSLQAGVIFGGDGLPNPDELLTRGINPGSKNAGITVGTDGKLSGTIALSNGTINVLNPSDESNVVITGNNVTVQYDTASRNDTLVVSGSYDVGGNLYTLGNGDRLTLADGTTLQDNVRITGNTTATISGGGSINSTVTIGSPEEGNASTLNVDVNTAWDGAIVMGNANSELALRNDFSLGTNGFIQGNGYINTNTYRFSVGGATPYSWGAATHFSSGDETAVELRGQVRIESGASWIFDNADAVLYGNGNKLIVEGEEGIVVNADKLSLRDLTLTTLSEDPIVVDEFILGLRNVIIDQYRDDQANDYWNWWGSQNYTGGSGKFRISEGYVSYLGKNGFMGDVNWVFANTDWSEGRTTTIELLDDLYLDGVWNVYSGEHGYKNNWNSTFIINGNGFNINMSDRAAFGSSFWEEGWSALRISNARLINLRANKLQRNPLLLLSQVTIADALGAGTIYIDGSTQATYTWSVDDDGNEKDAARRSDGYAAVASDWWFSETGGSFFNQDVWFDNGVNMSLKSPVALNSDWWFEEDSHLDGAGAVLALKENGRICVEEKLYISNAVITGIYGSTSSGEEGEKIGSIYLNGDDAEIHFSNCTLVLSGDTVVDQGRWFIDGESKIITGNNKISFVAFDQNEAYRLESLESLNNAITAIASYRDEEGHFSESIKINYSEEDYNLNDYTLAQLNAMSNEHIAVNLLKVAPFTASELSNSVLFPEVVLKKEYRGYLADAVKTLAQHENEDDELLTESIFSDYMLEGYSLDQLNAMDRDYLAVTVLGLAPYTEDELDNFRLGRLTVDSCSLTYDTLSYPDSQNIYPAYDTNDTCVVFKGGETGTPGHIARQITFESGDIYFSNSDKLSESLFLYADTNDSYGVQLYFTNSDSLTLDGAGRSIFFGDTRNSESQALMHLQGNSNVKLTNIKLVNMRSAHIGIENEDTALTFDNYVTIQLDADDALDKNYVFRTCTAESAAIIDLGGRTLDMNGYTMTVTGGKLVIQNGTLKGLTSAAMVVTQEGAVVEYNNVRLVLAADTVAQRGSIIFSGASAIAGAQGLRFINNSTEEVTTTIAPQSTLTVEDKIIYRHAAHSDISNGLSSFVVAPTGKLALIGGVFQTQNWRSINDSQTPVYNIYDGVERLAWIGGTVDKVGGGSIDFDGQIPDVDMAGNVLYTDGVIKGFRPDGDGGYTYGPLDLDGQEPVVNENGDVVYKNGHAQSRIYRRYGNIDLQGQIYSVETADMSYEDGKLWANVPTRDDNDDYTYDINGNMIFHRAEINLYNQIPDVVDGALVYVDGQLQGLISGTHRYPGAGYVLQNYTVELEWSPQYLNLTEGHLMADHTARMIGNFRVHDDLEVDIFPGATITINNGIVTYGSPA